MVRFNRAPILDSLKPRNYVKPCRDFEVNPSNMVNIGGRQNGKSQV